jgi:hypothetical protein
MVAFPADVTAPPAKGLVRLITPPAAPEAKYPNLCMGSLILLQLVAKLSPPPSNPATIGIRIGILPLGSK